jgi:ABC-type multidrug transport system fused ATPase/permease subunit
MLWFLIDHGRSRTPQNQSGELINRLSADTQLVGRTLTDNISDVLRSSAQAIAGFGMMAYMSPKLTGAGMHGCPYDVQTRQAL